MPKVMGLDLSLNAPALSYTGELKPGTTLKIDRKRGDRRLCDIQDWLDYYVSTWQPDLAMVEAVPPYATSTSALERVHGVAREVLARRRVPFAYVNVKALKSFATGAGDADKVAVMDAVEQQFGVRPEDDNAADAWVLRWMGDEWMATRKIGPTGLSGPQLQALSSIEWPLKPGDPTWPQPYGEVVRKATRRAKCKHGIQVLRNGDHWIHPFDILVCDKPPTRTR